MKALTINLRKLPGLLKNPVVAILLIILAWKLIVLGIGAASVANIHEAADPTHQNVDISIFLKGSFRFDAYYYAGIATHGYQEMTSGLQGFFPLFPYLLRLLGKIGIDFFNAASLINIVATYFASYFLYRLAELHFKDRRLAFKTILIFLFFPTAYFLNAFYTESLFCALSFGAFYYARIGRWWASNLLLAALTATRIPGILAAAAIGIEYLSQKQFKWRNIDKNILWFLLAPAGLAAYAALLMYKYHDPLMFIHATRYGFGFQVFNPNIFHTIWQELSGIVRQATQLQNTYVGAYGVWLYEVMFFGAWLFTLVVTLAGRKRLPLSYLAYVLMCLLLFCINSNFSSVNRYVLPLFPVYLILAGWLERNELAFAVWLAGSAMAFGLLWSLFANGFWTG